MKLPSALLLAALAASLGATATAGTTVHFGTVSSFSGPADLDLDGDIVYSVNFSADDPATTVNGVTFTPDTSPIPGASFTGPNQVTPWQGSPEFGNSVDDNALERILQDIRWANSGSGQTLHANLDVTAGLEYKLQLLISGNHQEQRIWDIRVDGLDCVDEISSLGVQPGAGYSQGSATVYTYQFAATDAQVNVVMGDLFGTSDGGDRNPIWQALTLEKVTVPPTPESLALSPLVFYSSQTAPVGRFETEDLKSGAAHLYSLVGGAGDADNGLFEIQDDTLATSALHDFGAHAPGATFAVRVRATDAEDPARFLEEAFTVTLGQPLAPTALALSASSISSGAIAGTPVGRLSTADPNAVDAHAYALVAGAGDADNARFTVDGDWLRLAAGVPAERSELSLRVRSTDLAGLSLDQIFTLAVTEPSLRINEVMASNGATLNDEDGDASDWLEIFNEQAGAANLNGWFLTDDPDDLTKWPFPAVTVGANDYLLVFASGKDRAPADGSELHANFQLDSGGEFLALVEPDGLTVADQLDFPDQQVDVSYGHNPPSTELGFMQAATPGAANSDTAAQIVNPVQFSHPRGYYSEGFELTLTAALPGSTIRYTTNGQEPSATSGSVYSGPISVGPETGSAARGTRRVRAIAVHPAAAIMPVETHTYLWVNGTGVPAADGVIGQANFRSAITGHPTYGPLMDDGLLALPAVSVTKLGAVGSSEQETTLELISNDGSEPGFGVDCGIKIVGGASVGSAKNNWRLYFRSQYGAPKLRYPVFADHPYSAGASEEFDVLQLRGGSHDNFYWMANPNNQSNGAYRPGDAQYVRNRWISDMEMLMGHTSLHGRFVHCYFNGVYHGLYHLHERPMHHYMDKYFGGDPEDFHYTNSGRTGSDHGGGDSWNSTWSQVRNAASAGGQGSRDWINWEVLADNQLLYFYAGNAWDWTTRHNWMAAGPKEPGEGGWRFYSWDCDVMIYDVTANNLNTGAPDGVFTALMNDLDFAVLFRDRVYKHCFHDGLLAPGGPQQSYDYRMNEIFDAIVPETARWQGAAINPPWDRDDEWTNEWGYITNTYWTQRTGILLDQLRGRGWYPLEAPEFEPRGGEVAEGFSPAITSGAGAIYLTSDGSDPRLPGGAINPAARAVGGAVVTTPLIDRGSVWRYLDDGSDQGSAWRAPGFDDSGWASGPAELGYGDGAEGAEGTVVDYGPSGTDKHITTYFRRGFEVGGAAGVQGLLMGLRRDDGAVVYLNGTEVWRSGMPPGAIGPETLASNASGGADETTFHIKPDIPPALLLEGPNTLAVEVHQNAPTSSDISFDLELSATGPADPSELALSESTLLKARVLQGGEWSPLSEAVFTIGDAADATNLAVSEFSYRPAPPTVEEDPAGIYSRTDFEFIELTNISDGPVHLADLRITDGVDFDFADSPVVGLGAGESVLIVEDRDAFLARYPAVDPARIAGEYGSNLSNDGERIEILGAGGAVVRAFTYNDKAPWPEAADGDGFTLELIAPFSNPDHGDPLNWRSSRGIHGTPAGSIAAMDFTEWQMWNFTPAELAELGISGPSADLDGDGLTNFAEFALGTAPDDPANRAALPEATVVQLAGERYLELSYRAWSGASGVGYAVEISTDFSGWGSGPGHTVEVGDPVDHGDGTVTRTFRSAQPVSSSPRAFVRLNMSAATP